MKKILFSMLFGVVLIAGCANSTEPSLESASVTSEEVNPETKEIKQNLLDRLEAIKNETETAREAHGYLEKEDYVKIKKEFDFLAKVAHSEAFFEYNDTQEIDDKIEDLEDDINHLSHEELFTVEERFNSGSIIYETMIKEDLHSIISSLDLTNNYNDLRTFMTLAESANESEIYSMAADYSENLREYDLNNLNAIQEILSENAPAFTEEELSNINDALQNLINSAETQIKILSRFEEFYLDDGSTIDDLISEAQIEFETGTAIISDLEESYDIH